MKIKILSVRLLVFTAIILVITIPLIQASPIKNLWYNTLSFLGIIEITNANHLNSDRVIISDIYEEVKELDGVWSEEIRDGDYVRVRFEKMLASGNDITIYPKVIGGNPRIEIYEKDESDLIAEFAEINANEYNKAYLTNLQGKQDTFDLRVVGGSLEFEHIIDPRQESILTINTAVTLCGEVNNYTIVRITSSGVLNICPFNGTAGTGYVNITLGLYGNFTVDSGGVVNGNGSGGTGGVGSTSTSACSTQGDNGNTSTAGTTSCSANGGGGSGGQRTDAGGSVGGGGGAFGGAGGKGGSSASGYTQSVGGNTYRNSTETILKIGSGGGGESGDAPYSGAAGGGGIKVNASSGWIIVAGTINVSGIKGTDGDKTDDSGGGGGSGGHVILIARNMSLDNGVIYASGGKGGDGISGGGGSDSCGGGGGGGGRIAYLYQTISQTSLTNISSGGQRGVGIDADCDLDGDALGATNGTAGSVSYNTMTFPTPDLTEPAIVITSPANNTNTSDTEIDINYTVSDTNLQTCWYSNDTYTSNTTLTCGTNITSVVWTTGQHNVTLWANDSWGNWNSTSLTFNILSADTCTYGGSGNWALNCADNCVFATTQTIGNNDNVTITGAGALNFSSGGKWSFTGSSQYVTVASGCTLNINTGGGWNY